MSTATGSTSVTRFFSFLAGTINVLLVDDMPEVLDYLRTVLAQVKVYSIKVARTAREAAIILQQPQRIHQVTLDLGMADFENDEFGLLRRFGTNSHFVVVTGQHDTEKGGQCVMLGAKGVIHKPMELNELVPKINGFSLKSILTPRIRLDSDSLILRSIDVLLRRKPKTVSDWSRELSITDGGLWKAWDENCGVAAKNVLLIHTVYSAAFNYFENLILNPDDDPMPLNTKDYERLTERFLTTRSALAPLLK